MNKLRLSAECLDPLDRTTAAKMLRVIAGIRDESAGDLLRRFGPGHWAGQSNIPGMKRELKKGRQLYLVRNGEQAVATFAVAENGPRFLRPAWFTDPKAPALYLTGMAVAPAWQGRGVGRWIIKFIANAAAERGRKSVRFDAYDAPAGAANFYLKCGCNQRRRFGFNGVPLIAFEMD